MAIDLVRSENRLQIEWEDGGRSDLGGERLRWACPCAECRGEMGVPGRLDRDPELPAAELTLSEVGLIGQYALMIGFASGHATGIYTFRLLRNLDRPAPEAPAGRSS